MSYHIFFDMSEGLSKPLQVPLGTKQTILDHVLEVEAALGLERAQFQDNPVYWNHFKMDFSKLANKLVCETIKDHNFFIRRVYADFGHWHENPCNSEHFKDSPRCPHCVFTPSTLTETITIEDAKLFWHGLKSLNVPIGQWTPEYYTNRMEHLYEVMRGRESEGVTFEAKALTPKQAAAVINIFSFLDNDDRRLDVPNGHDHLASSYDGGYTWCEKCGAMDPDDADACRKRKCPIRAEHEALEG